MRMGPRCDLTGVGEAGRQERAAAVRAVRALRAELGSDHGTGQRVAQLGTGVARRKMFATLVPGYSNVACSPGYRRGVNRPPVAVSWTVNALTRRYGVPPPGLEPGTCGFMVRRSEWLLLILVHGVALSL
jgi:hypothetical protein